MNSRILLFLLKAAFQSVQIRIVFAATQRFFRTALLRCPRRHFVTIFDRIGCCLENYTSLMEASV
jgi:hypothetical protein